MKTHYLAVAPNYWGKGETIAAAKRELRRQTNVPATAIYEVPGDYWIDDYGAGHGSAPAKLVSGKDLRRAECGK